jgi:hypothetical protein
MSSFLSARWRTPGFPVRSWPEEEEERPQPEHKEPRVKTRVTEPRRGAEEPRPRPPPERCHRGDGGGNGCRLPARHLKQVEAF